MKYKTAGVCAQEINFEIENVNGENIVKSVQFVGGCNGNASGISKLVEGMKVSDVENFLPRSIISGIETS
jgi:uncharacterized protein (TIGR03905 family)